MNILVWATTFGADLWSLTKYLDQRDDTRVKVVLDDPATFGRQAVARLYPLRASLVRRRSYHQLTGLPGFRPDVTIIDNRVPWRAASPKCLVLWHGFGWKGPNDVAELRVLHSMLAWNWGSIMAPNPHLRWQTFGPWDFEHRTTVSGIHPENARILGAASHDDLVRPFERRWAQPYYPFDIVSSRVVLIAPTWHYGDVFAHWGEDRVLFHRLFSHLQSRGVNVILRLHDSFRFEKAYLRCLKGLAEAFPNVVLKFKDSSPDNMVDLQIADVLVTNFSSIANLFYATRRPTVHVYPVANADEAFMWRRYTPLGVINYKKVKPRFIWKLPPEDHGGLLAHSFDELVAQLDQALEQPDCCAAQVEQFLQRHMLGADGHTCERVWQTLLELVNGCAKLR